MKSALLRLWCRIRGYHRWNVWVGVGAGKIRPLHGTLCGDCRAVYDDRRGKC